MSTSTDGNTGAVGAGTKGVELNLGLGCWEGFLEEVSFELH